MAGTIHTSTDKKIQPLTFAVRREMESSSVIQRTFAAFEGLIKGLGMIAGPETKKKKKKKRGREGH
jgi:hypothetical protein